MRVLLAYLCNYRDRHDYYKTRLPAGLFSIAVCLEKEGFDVALANFSKMGWRKALQHISSIKPDVAGISLFTHNRIDSLKLIKGIKKALPDTIIVLGGPHATLLADEILKRYKEVDYIIKGEGEKLFTDLLVNIKHGKQTGSKVLPRERINDLNSLPAPEEFSGQLIGVDPAEQFKFIITSRGCPEGCAFCSSPQLWQRIVRYRSVGSIFREIKKRHEQYGIIYFYIVDDNFTINKKRVLQFSQILQKSGLGIMWSCQSRVDTIDEEMLIAMKRAGLDRIWYGVESGSEKILKLYHKHTTIKKIERAAALARRAGVYLTIYLMSGMLGERRRDINETKALINRILPCEGFASYVKYLPGTRLFEQAREKGLVDDSDWFESSDDEIQVRTDAAAIRWGNELVSELERIKKKSSYQEQDFALHRRVTGQDCWVTDIMEGDYYFKNNRYAEAERCYRTVIEQYPQNPWGFFAMGRLKYHRRDYPHARELYRRLTQLVPAIRNAAHDTGLPA
jgi:anaerobic magnesium-protoporphyrin IX monomethyl ester cyclase